MQSWTLLLLCLLFIGIPDVLARRGGGGSDSDGGSNNDSGGGGSGGDSSSGDEHCGTPEHPIVWKWDLIPPNAQNDTKGKGSDYGGSFFKGEASLDYTIVAGEACNLNSTESTHMLGYAWIGPQAPYPVGPTNPIIIGFKAWETDKSLGEIGDSYTYIKNDDYCPQMPDLFRVTTTQGWTDFDARTYRAADVMNMTVTEGAADQGKVFFNATAADKINEQHAAGGVLLSLPRGTCRSPHGYSFPFPDRLAMNGSFTNTTLNLTFSGRGNATSNDGNDELTAEFKVTFAGVFDGDNSTQKLSLQQPGEPLVEWVANSALRDTPLVWLSSLAYVVTLGLLI